MKLRTPLAIAAFGLLLAQALPAQLPGDRPAPNTRAMTTSTGAP
jgi:hypothetical protein